MPRVYASPRPRTPAAGMPIHCSRVPTPGRRCFVSLSDEGLAQRAMPDPASPRRASRDRITLWLLVVVVSAAVALGIWLRLSLLGAGSLWLDELWTLDAVSRSFKEMIGARLVSDSKPPLWSVLTWIWLRVAGTYDPATMRLLPLGFSLAAIAAPVLGAVKMPSLRPTLLVLSALTALSLFPLAYAVELRSYSMMIAFGTAATVVWAGLLTGDLPRRGGWIFLFSLTGALAGFSHYYGHLLYVGELLALGVSWAPARPRRPLAILLGWAGVSLVPVAVWYVLTSRWFPTEPVATAPSWSTIQTWLAYGFGPVSNVLASHAPGYPYPDGALGAETIMFALTAALILGAVALGLRTRGTAKPLQSTVLVGGAGLFVVAFGVAVAWVVSIILPPSMNVRNLAALLPALFLAVACASTIGRSEHGRRWTGAVVVAVWVIATAAVIGQFGVTALTPPWQAQAGYRATVRTLLASTHEEPAVALIGLKLPWDWHGEWDAAARAELGLPPAESDDPAPLDVRWILDVQELRPSGLPDSPLLVFTDARDQRSVDLFRWVEEVRAGCERMVIGGPGFGAIDLLQCPADP